MRSRARRRDMMIDGFNKQRRKGHDGKKFCCHDTLTYCRDYDLLVLWADFWRATGIVSVVSRWSGAMVGICRGRTPITTSASTSYHRNMLTPWRGLPLGVRGSHEAIQNSAPCLCDSGTHLKAHFQPINRKNTIGRTQAQFISSCTALPQTFLLPNLLTC